MTNSQSKNIGTLLLGLLVATAPFTASAQTASTDTVKIAVAKSQLAVGQRYFISGDSLNVRSSNSTTASNIVGQLGLNDVVEIYDVLNEATPLVQVKIIKSVSVSPTVAAELFVSKDYLSAKEITVAVSQYFVIQNVATEKTRVYERCTTSPNCPHKMVMETDMVVGRNEEGTKTDKYAYMTWLGHSRIATWVKFYADGAQNYPNWYTAGQDIKSIPKPITDGSSRVIGSRKWMVDGKNGDSTIYGAFGWYAAKLTPSDEVNGVNNQWMHGTIGWGKDGSAAIDITRGFFMNMFSNPGSHGCTRLENRAIAYLRSILPVGTDIYRVYARESTRDLEVTTGSGSSLKTIPMSRYASSFNKPLRWDYILLTNGAQQSNGLTADAKTIIEKAIAVTPGVNFIEQGSYEVDQYPTPVPLNYKKSASSGESGDRYRIDSGKEKDPTNFRGFFLVDEGRFVDYQHPNETAVKGKVHVSGLLDFRNSVPEFLKTSGTHYPRRPDYKSAEDDLRQRGH